MCDAPIEIAGKFCKYFSNIDPKLAEKIPNSNDTYTRFSPPKTVTSLFLDPASSQEIILICNSLRPGIAAGYDIPIGIVKETIGGPDNISCWVLKEAATVIAPFLHYIFTLSMQTGHVPSDWVTANVTPVFKKGNRNEPSNYRPISLTSVPCKIMEHILLYEY